MHRTTALLLGTLIACTGSCAAADWPQFLGENRDGVSKETGLARTWPQSRYRHRRRMMAV